MGIITHESQAAHVGRLRRLATQTAAKGMSCTVSGLEIRGVLAAHDTAVERVAVLEAELAAIPRPKVKGKPDPFPGEVHELLMAVNEILSIRSELWGQQLGVAVKAWATSSGDDELPASWSSLLDAL